MRVFVVVAHDDLGELVDRVYRSQKKALQRASKMTHRSSSDSVYYYVNDNWPRKGFKLR